MAKSDEKRKSGWKRAAWCVLICLGGVSCSATSTPAPNPSFNPAGSGADLPFRKPVEHSERAPETDAKPVIAESGALQQHLDSANALAKQGKFAEAEAHIRRVVELEPLNSGGYIMLGGALGGQGKNAEAEAAFRRAIELDPKDPNIHMALAKALAGQGKDAEAAESYRRAGDLIVQ